MPFKDPQRAREYQKEYQARWHQDHRTERLAEVARRKSEVYWYIQDIKNTWACADCGVRHPAVLQFHHRNREEKVFNISDAARNKLSLDTLKKEISKCIVLCANCHLIRHWRERNQTSSLATQLEQVERELTWTPQEQEAYEKVFGASGDPNHEYHEYLEYYGADPRNHV